LERCRILRRFFFETISRLFYSCYFNVPFHFVSFSFHFMSLYALSYLFLPFLFRFFPFVFVSQLQENIHGAHVWVFRTMSTAFSSCPAACLRCGLHASPSMLQLPSSFSFVQLLCNFREVWAARINHVSYVFVARVLAAPQLMWMSASLLAAGCVSKFSVYVAADDIAVGATISAMAIPGNGVLKVRSFIATAMYPIRFLFDRFAWV
jgi:hypothetical protein